MGSHLFSGDSNGEITIIEIATQKILKKWKAHSDTITSLILNENKQHLYSSSGDKTIKRWSLNSEELMITMNHHTDGIT